MAEKPDADKIGIPIFLDRQNFVKQLFDLTYAVNGLVHSFGVSVQALHILNVATN